jgi:hypothetical protein
MMQYGKLVGLIAFAVLLGSQARAASITYALTDTIYGLGEFGFGSGTATGTITTDGVLGSLSINDITDWSITVRLPADSFTFTPTDSSINTTYPSGLGITATPNALLFNFSPSGNNVVYGLEFDAFINGPYQGSAAEWVGCSPPVAAGHGQCSVAAAGAEGIIDPGFFSAFSSLTGSGDRAIADVPSTPLPDTLSLFVGGLSVLGLIVRAKKRQSNSATVAA